LLLLLVGAEGAKRACQLTLKPVYITNTTLKVNFQGFFWNSDLTLLYLKIAHFMKITLMSFCCQLIIKPVYNANTDLKVKFQVFFWNSEFTFKKIQLIYHLVKKASMQLCCQLTLKPVYITNTPLKVNFEGILWNFDFTCGCSAYSLRSNHVPHRRCGRLYFDITFV
jgi:hypothetical protein